MGWSCGSDGEIENKLKLKKYMEKSYEYFHSTYLRI
jgi:hypothetical protein